MKFPDWLPVYGDKSYRGKCNKEETDQTDFVAWLKFNYPEHWTLMIHPKMEGKRTPQQIAKDKKTGSLKRSASDIIIPAFPAFVCELKRKDHTNRSCAWQDGQLEYLELAKNNGAFVCVALGADGAKEAFIAWLDQLQQHNSKNQLESGAEKADD